MGSVEQTLETLPIIIVVRLLDRNSFGIHNCPVAKRSLRIANRNLVFHAIVEIHGSWTVGQD